MNAKILPIISIVMLLASCARIPPSINVNETPVSDDAAQIKLAEAASSISQSLEQLAAMEKAVHPNVKIPPPPDPASIGMARLASVNWNGPVEPLIRKIAAASYYRVQVSGKRPAIPALVSVSAQNTPVADILRDASFQVEKKADIVVYPRRRIIEIRYVGY